MKGQFEFVGIREPSFEETEARKSRCKGKPVFSAVFLALLIAGCVACELIMTKDPTYLDLQNCNVPPNREFLFGTDSLGRDIFSMIWYGGRVSLFIGIVSASVSVAVAVVIGAVSGTAPVWADALLMRLTEILLGVPELLLVLFLQAAFGKASILSVSFVIGITGWMNIAKVIRTEVRRLRSSEYVIASKCMGGSFLHILWKHLLPNFVSSVMFMVVMNVRNAIAAESTLSFLGIGLPVEVISWGSMLSLSENALLSNSWWLVLIPGAFLAATLMSITNLGNSLRKNMNRKESNF